MLPASGTVLEIASGSGEHAAYLAEALPHLQFQPSDPSPEARASIDAWCSGLPNVAAALALDAETGAWPIQQADCVLCINMIHIAPWSAAQGLISESARILPQTGFLVLYGPFLRAGVPTAPSNLSFDASLRGRNPEWGIRDLDKVTALAGQAGFEAAIVEELPANNLVISFRRGSESSAGSGARKR